MIEEALLEKIKKIREAFEKGLVNKQNLSLLYSKYTSVPEPDRFVRDAFLIFPFLNCGLTSVYLREQLKEGRIVQGKYRHHPHTYLQLSDDRIIDITADQYDGQKVYIGILRAPWS